MQTIFSIVSPFPRIALAAVLASALAGCSGFGAVAPAPSTLPVGLSARMDQPGAQLDRAQALGLVNAYRATTGAPMLTEDAALTAQAQQLANQYASSGQAPAQPAGAAGMKLSAGYATFADTFSGWRNSPADAPALTNAGATRAGVAMAFNPNSTYGIHWVLLLGN